MIINAGSEYAVEIRKGESSPKFGGDALVEYMYEASLNDSNDYVGGDDWGLWVHNFGKRNLVGNDQGSVWCEQWDDIENAMLSFSQYEADYNAWCNAVENGEEL